MGMHHKTPTLTVVDPRGLSIRSVDYWRAVDNLPTEARISRTVHDGAGRAVKQWDPRLWALQVGDSQAPANLTTVYSLSGNALRTDSVDAGTQINLYGLADEVLLGRDSRETCREVEYDDLLRPVAVFEQGAAQPRRCVERFEYGCPGQGNQDHNQYGQLIRHDDPAGSVLFDAFAISGQCVENTRHFTLDPVTPDWPELINDRQRLLEPGLGATSAWRFGPLGDGLERTDAKGNRQVFSLTLDGLLRETRLRLHGLTTWQMLVSDIQYSAQGQVEHETTGNAVQTTLVYRPEDGLLMERRVQDAGTRMLQHLIYDYDPMGNVLSIEDQALPVRYFANQRIDPINRFSYDSLYQLIEASGWEAGGPNQGPESVGRTDPAALGNYRQTYRYDAGGNLLKLTHVGAQDHGRDLKAARYSNRCLPYRNGVPPTEDEIAAAFDAKGNLLELDQRRFLTWDLRNQLQSVSPVERASGRNDRESYLYDGGGQRIRKIRSLQTNARTVVADVRYLPGLEWRTDNGTGEVLQVITAQAGLNSVRVLHWESTPPSGTNDQYRYGFTDHLGSISLELAADARIISRETFYPFGETACLAGDDVIEVSYKTVRYSGKERDATGLYYYGYRYYIPWLQRWLKPDPAGTVDGLNLYRMVRNNPVGLVDENGLNPDKAKGSLVSSMTGLSDGAYASGAPAPARPPIPLRPGALPSASPRPPVPTRSSPVQMNVAAPAKKEAPQRPPAPIALPTASPSTGALPSYATDSMVVGSHSLSIGPRGGVVAMRGDNRDPDQIRTAGGFFPRDNRGSKIKEEFRQAAVTKGINTLAQEHVRSPVAGYVSTGMDEDSGGYGDTRAFLYRMEIPGLKERAINDQTLGLGSPFKFIPKGRLGTRVLMSGDTLDQSEFVAMIPPMTVEMTFITPIPSAHIVAYRPAKSNQWIPF
ncbi:RHS repeat-associated core domain-containing protein [Pseudomonas sp. P9_31]|uniref:RHS repeat-associated core domain-containing protein n=1 Tax=Pseudomonas sp. P9_31 TaxID=3043448 RepID=UPI002A367BFF|nr:RHS repeat-associated core domain-containing protein [Pseudomonas sp. P9_31]WPN57085.1 RHS repeat-associated core domain-containing protein [Pseudomonas sp. P9_31]